MPATLTAKRERKKEATSFMLLFGFWGSEVGLKTESDSLVARLQDLADCRRYRSVEERKRTTSLYTCRRSSTKRLSTRLATFTQYPSPLPTLGYSVGEVFGESRQRHVLSKEECTGPFAVGWYRKQEAWDMNGALKSTRSPDVVKMPRIKL